jgi:predicted membrane protein
MDQKQIELIIDNTYILTMLVVVSKLNKGITQFFLSEFIMFLVFTLYQYKRNKNILVSVATAFAMVVFVTLITVESSIMTEAFDIISPTSNTKIGCEKITMKDLVDKYGSEQELKKVMVESGVPYNLNLDDRNAPEIATYLVSTMRAKLSDTCV